jgi:hypothetical protein
VETAADAAARRVMLMQLATARSTMRSTPLFRDGALADLLRRGNEREFDGGDTLSQAITVELALRATETD